MVARINSSKSVSWALQYNEQKVEQGQAQCLAAHLFLKAPEVLTFPEKLQHFQCRIALNQRVVTNTVHLSLNFDPQDVLNKEKLVRIAASYMQKIGFGGQPYLVYQHFDAGHPHLHVVTTNIQSDGDRIALHNLGREKSEKARQEIEREWHLTPAKGHRPDTAQKHSYAQKVEYGTMGTKQAINSVLSAVYPHYRYTSLEEYNAVLRLYNVVAERGSVTSRMQRGLMYRILDENGRKIGTPIKASAFELQPTLKNLEIHFRQNEVLRQGHKQRLENKIHRVLLQRASSFETFQKALAKEGIHVLQPSGPKYTREGLIYVDHTTKSVFHESVLEPNYRVQAIYQKQGVIPSEKKQQEIVNHQTFSQEPSHAKGLLHTLLAPVSAPDPEPNGFRQNKKKRKRLYHHF